MENSVSESNCYLLQDTQSGGTGGNIEPVLCVENAFNLCILLRRYLKNLIILTTLELGD